VQRLREGKVVTVWDEHGNVFTPDPTRPSVPAYSYGPAQGKAKTRNVMFTCPVSGIPEPVIALLELWNECRLMGLPPVQGGLLDQPLSVRKSFPIFTREYEAATARERAAGSHLAASAATMATLQALFGGKGGK
jgi:hypothetical protein